MSDRDEEDDEETLRNLDVAIEQLTGHLNQPMTPQQGRLLASMDQTRASLRDNPDAIPAAAEATGISEEDMREWVFQEEQS